MLYYNITFKYIYMYTYSYCIYTIHIYIYYLHICTRYGYGYTSSPPQEKVFIWPPFSEYKKRLLRQKTGGACLYMPQDGHWLASFEVIPPPK